MFRFITTLLAISIIVASLTYLDEGIIHYLNELEGL